MSWVNELANSLEQLEIIAQDGIFTCSDALMPLNSTILIVGVLHCIVTFLCYRPELQDFNSRLGSLIFINLLP